MRRVTEYIIRYKWLVIVFWLMVAAVVFFTAPSLADVAKNDQASFLPGNADAVKADKLVRELFPDKGGRSTVVLAIKRKGGIEEADKEYAVKLEEYLNLNKSELMITEVLSPFSKKEFAEEMISGENEAALIIASLSTPGYTDATNKSVIKIRNDINGEGEKIQGRAALPKGLEVYVTGDASMSQEEHESVNESMDLTVKITIFLVAFILILIYRSPVAPVLPLATIGISYVISRGLIAAFTELGMKVSSFTDTFLIAVLFGAGTDYCLLIISRFKEEISAGKSVSEALKDTMPHTAKAVISSGGTVIVGFSFMIFAKFGLFNTTGPSVAIGVAITILAVLSLIPAFIAIFGEMIFWPAHPSRSGKVSRAGSRFWERVANTVVAKPIRFILISLAVFVPFLIATNWITMSYDQLSELPASTDSVKGFNVMKKHFDQGAILPLKLVMKWEGDAWTNDSLQLLDRIADNIVKVDDVAEVRTATRPIGEKITETTISKQISLLSEGLGKVQEGFDPVVAGLGEMQKGMEQIAAGVDKGSEELKKLAEASVQTRNGVSQARTGLGQLSTGTVSAADGLERIGGSLTTLAGGLGKSKSGLDDIHAALKGTVEQLEQMMKNNPDLAASKDFQAAYGTIKGTAENLDSLSSNLTQIQGGISASANGIVSTKKGLQDIDGGIKNSGAALGQIQKGLDAMAQGQAKAGESLKTASSNLIKIASGAASGQDALNKMKTGIGSVQNVTGEYSDKKNMLAEGFFIPEGTLEKYPELRKAMGNYISPASNGVTLDVVLKISPYSNEALDRVDQIRDAVSFTVKGTPLEKSEFYIGGATSVLSEVRSVTAQDFVKVMVFVLLGIFIVLALLLRSIIAPMYLILTILISYATTMGITRAVFQGLLGYEGLNWAVPFFAFCVLVALGVDYNIFLMSRVKEEYKPGDIKGGNVRGLAGTGGIITSCGLIMAGTFRAMLVSPVRPLVEVGFAAVVGLLIDTFIIRCLMVPAIAVKVGELNWWPGRKVRIVAGDNDAR